MTANAKQSNIGRKIWHGLAITLSVLVALVGIAAVVGTWVAGNTLSSATIQMLLVVENTADGLTTIVEGIDTKVAGLEEATFAIAEATNQLSQNVTDKGLILTLLPEEREQKLVTQAQELQQNLNSVGNTLKAGLELYQSIDSLPFVSLPKPEQQTVSKLEQTIADIQATTQNIVLGIQEFRDGVSGEIGRVTGLLDDITARMTETRQNLAQLKGRLEALKDLAARIRGRVTLVFNSLSAIITLFLAWVVYSQVEIIRLHVQRWKSLDNVSVLTLPAEEPTDSDLPDADDVKVEEADVPKEDQ
jgi:hypothetical protein